MSDFEKLGAFYLGRVYDGERGQVKDELLLYDSKDLTTHALCVGMTGSGKTGLCIALLEEAGIDGIPAVIIDPKGDLGNLLLTFPEVRPTDFQPWVDPAEAGRKGLSLEEHATQTAQLWKNGLADWGQDGARIARFRDAVDLAIYTPGSSAGRPLRALRSLTAPSRELAADGDALRGRVQAAVSGLLSLLDIEADPIRSREHILLSTLVDRAWREGRDLEIASLIAEIQSPPVERVGVLELESFFPSKERFALAMSLNNLLASPGFGAWMEGEPLDVGRLLYTREGRPRLSILSIAHLADRERMFFVTLLLNEVISWMRAQPGTSSLRALLYMDEVFGYFPPTANPPSKTPMLTLLKQARAYGLGIVLATQNPVDLDYKGLANAGTWFLGRLQTERDKERVLDGLEGATAAAGATFDRGTMDRILSGLKSRLFLMNNVHDDRPELFQTRWALSYLRGPLTRDQIRSLSRSGASAAPAVPEATIAGPTPARQALAGRDAADRPLLAPDVPQLVLAHRTPIGAGGSLVYRPALLGSARLHYVDQRAGIDRWEAVHLVVPVRDEVSKDPWEEGEALRESPAIAEGADPAGKFSALPPEAARARSYPEWGKRLKEYLYRELSLRLLRSPQLDRYSTPAEDEGAFRARLRHVAREERDLEIEKLRKKYAPKLTRLQDRIRSAEERVAREQGQQRDQTLQTVVSLGATVLGALFGRKAASVGTIGRAATTMHRAGRIGRERGDVARAEKRLEELRDQLEEFDAEFEKAREGLGSQADPEALEIEEYLVRPRKSDIEVKTVSLVWTPWSVSTDGIAERAF